MRRNTLAAEAAAHADKLKAGDTEAREMNLAAVVARVLFLARVHIDRRVGVVYGKTFHMIERELGREDGRRQTGEGVQQNAAHDEQEGGGHGE